jgi:hypothetical protein
MRRLYQKESRGRERVENLTQSAQRKAEGTEKERERDRSPAVAGSG